MRIKILFSRTFILFALLSAALVLALPAGAFAGVVTNTSTGTPYTSIQSALNDASPGDTLWAEGLFNEHDISWGVNDITLMTSLTATAPATIDGGSVSRVIVVSTAVNMTIEGITIQNGMVHNDDGAGIDLTPGAYLTLRDVNILSCTTDWLPGNQVGGGGAAVWSVSDTVEADNCYFAGNSAIWGDAGYGGDWTISTSEFSGNIGDLCVFGFCKIQAINCVFDSNLDSVLAGGGINYQMHDCVFSNNEGGVAQGGTMNVTESTFERERKGLL